MNLLLAHLVGDYILQTDWMATQKKWSSYVCMVHALTYTIPFVFCGFLWWQLLLVVLQHFFQDRSGFVVWFMEVKGSGSFATGPLAPWSVIVTDNILHLLWVVLVAHLPIIVEAVRIWLVWNHPLF